MAACCEVVHRELRRVVLRQPVDQRLEVPVLLEVARAVLGHQLLGHAGQQVLGPLLEVVAVDDLQAALVDHLALLVHHLVVLEGVLAHLGVARLDGVLGPLDGLGHRLGLDRHVLGQRAPHDPAHGPGGEEAQQLVVEAQVEAALTGVALAARAAAQLVVDAPALVALAAQHVEAPELAHLLALGPAARLEWRDCRRSSSAMPSSPSRSTPSAASSCWARSSALPPRMMSTPRPAMLVATVTAPRRPAWATTSASRKCCLALRTLCGDALLVQQAGQQLGLGHRGGADQHGLAPLVALHDVLDHRVELRLLGLEDEVGLVDPDHRPCWWGWAPRAGRRWRRTRRPRSRPCRSCRTTSRTCGSSSAGSPWPRCGSPP